MANEFKIKKGLIVEGASGGTVVNVLGSQGQLLSVTDDLSGSIFAVSDISGVPIFDVNSSGISYFDGKVGIGIANPLYQLHVEGPSGIVSRITDGTQSIDLYTGSGLSEISATTKLLLSTSGTTALTLDSSQNATFAGKIIAGVGASAQATINAFSTTVSTGLYSALRIIDNTSASSYWDIGATGAASTLLNFYHNSNISPKISFTHTGGATFAGKATSSATIASDGSTTLTTKSYVDGLVTGVPVYKGTWAAGTTGVTSAAINGTTITLTAAPTETIAVGDVVTADGIITATTVTAVASQTSVTVSATAVIATGITVTFSPEGGYPDLTLAAAKVLGNYYIVSTAGGATPNGTGTEPDSWAVGDWCIFSDVTPGTGTDLWQRIDNSSVISGAGTGGTIPLWEGATNAVSETLTDSPITVSGNDTTFAGGASIATDTGLVATAPIFNTNTSSRVMYLRGENIIQFQNTAGDNKWENVGRDGTYYVYKNDGTGSGMKYQIDGSGNHAFTGVVTLNSLGAGTLVTNSAGTISVSPDGVLGDYLPLIGGTLTGNLFVGQANLMIAPSNGGRIGFNRNTDTGAILNSAYEAFQINGASAAGDFLDFQNYSSTGAFLGQFVLKNGKMGIGLDGPSSKLHVRTSTNHNFEFEETGGELRISALNDARTANIPLQFASSQFSFISGDVLVGKTSNTIATSGAKIGTTTGTNITRDSNEVLYLNRTTNFGKTLSIAKDGTTIGEIGTYSGVPYIGYSQGGGGGIMFNGLSIEPTAVGASRSSGTNDIGSTNYKWKQGWFSSTLQSNILKLDTGRVELTSQSTTKLELFTNQVTLTAGGLTVLTGFNASNDGAILGNETGDMNIMLAGGSNNKILYLEGSSGNVGIGTKTPGSKLDIQGTQGQLFSVTDDLSGSIFAVADISGVPIFDVNSSGVSYFDGNVGINVTNPDFQSVGGYGQIGIEIKGGKENNQAPCIRLHETGSGKGSFELRSNRNTLSSGNYFAIAEGTDTFFTIRGDDDSGGITTRGNVGIGTTSPGTKLDIQDVPANIDGLRVSGNATVGQSYGIRINAGTSLNDYALAVANQANSALFRVRGDGNVGVNDTSPSHKFDVNGDIRGSQYWLRGNATNPTSTTASIYDQASVGLTLSAHNISFRNYNGSSMVESARFTTSSLTVIGDVVAYGSPSDIRLKENIKPIESALDKAMKLQGVTFDWKESDSILDIKEDIGFIAQDVQKVIPELVRENEDGMLSMRHQGIAPILLEAIKELKAEIDLLKSKPCTCNKCNCNI